ncbi:MAG: ComF family protein [Pseudomonadota bacterium]
MSLAPASLLNTLLPNPCSLCSLPTGRSIALCLACEGELPWLRDSCRQCALPLPPGGSFCGQCLTNPPPLDRCIAAVAYAPPVSQWVQAGKDKGDTASLAVLASLLGRAIDAYDDEAPDRITYVPLHWWRHWRRGFNQAAFIAERLCKDSRLARHHLPRPQPLARRYKSTPSQRQLDARARRRNLRHAFEPLQDLRGQHVVIVDDVMTTGATLNDLAATLKRAGARRVSAWCCARTLPPQPN